MGTTPLYRRLVNIPSRASRAGSSDAGEPAGRQATGVYLTPQSIVAFPVAASVVTVVWKVLAAVFPGWGESRSTLLVVALAVGALLFVISDRKGQTTRERIISIAIAVLNSFFLAASALGIDAAMGP
jgi:hypothetical protein